MCTVQKVNIKTADQQSHVRAYMTRVCIKLINSEMTNRLEKFKGHELTKNQYAQVHGSRSKSVQMLDMGGPVCAEVTTIDRNNGTIVQKIRYVESNGN